MTLKDDGLSEGREVPLLTGAACIFPLDGLPQGRFVQSMER